MRNVVKLGKYSLAKFPNFAYFVYELYIISVCQPRKYKTALIMKSIVLQNFVFDNYRFHDSALNALAPNGYSVAPESQGRMKFDSCRAAHGLWSKIFARKFHLLKTHQYYYPMTCIDIFILPSLAYLYQPRTFDHIWTSILDSNRCTF